MERFEMTPSSAFEATSIAGAERVTAFLRKVYGWMFVGLAITALAAFAVAGSQGIQQLIFGNPLLLIVLFVAQLGLVLALSARVDRLSPSTASALFLVYSALTGLTLSSIFLLYSQRSIAATFVVAAGMFGALALFGSITKRSLAGVGQFVSMGLVGLVLAMVVGFFWHSAGLQFGISVVGVIVFTGLAAWDAQKLKMMAVAIPEGQTGSYAV
ncbi:MAG: Bax inhibitor-1/YccA family protein, partial [Thermoanaerobaculia bacterium]